MQGIVSTGRVETEAYSHGVRASMVVANDEEEDGGNNQGVSGSGMRLLSYTTPERRVDLFRIQGPRQGNVSYC